MNHLPWHPIQRCFCVMALAFLASCTSFNPLGHDSKGPIPRPPRPLPHPDTRFAWGISTASYQYENPDVKQGDKNFFSTDWDIMVSKGGAPKKGNALFSWTQFEKDLAALKKTGVNHYRYSLEWARIEPRMGEFDEEAIDRYVEMARRLKEAGNRARRLPLAFHIPGLALRLEKSQGFKLAPPESPRALACLLDKVLPRLAPHVTYFAPQNEPNGQITTAYIAGQWPPAMTLSRHLLEGDRRQHWHVPRRRGSHQKSETLCQGRLRRGSALVGSLATRSRRAFLQYNDPREYRPPRPDLGCLRHHRYQLLLLPSCQPDLVPCRVLEEGTTTR
jgi:hypothetical protein